MFDQYQQVEQFLQKRRQYGVKPGLERINKLLYLLGDPENNIQAIHIAGTNGKGSTVHYLKKALMANGFHVGAFQSPSLTGYTGHITLNDTSIPETAFVYYANIIYPVVERLDAVNHHPTEFEIITAMAFLYFADTTDIALIEAGMGGRADTTNCFMPLLSIITNVSWDHTAFLGKTLDAIAWHKAGIIKGNKPIIAGEMNQDARSVIEQEASSQNAPLYLADEAFHYKTANSNGSELAFNWLSNAGDQLEITLPTAGVYQINNASLAVMALVLLKDIGFQLDMQVSARGLAETRIPGRFEQMHTRPAIILDGAHNLGGVRAFTTALQYHYADADKHLIFAAFHDKDLKNMLDELEPYFSSVTLTTFDHPRAASLEQLQNNSHHQAQQAVQDWRKAIRDMSSARENDCCCITGSMQFIGMVRAYMHDGPCPE
ncbi:bifunctional tetrahydrofolate synthase/dihydrofolate synthase [Barrientosiimonas marina]|uniref:tetrahydrofolate synthase n=1 Tax=Lentibacillus kimchii TaxID=1542911 RepID=A0ABW2UZI9_9BACI